LKTSVLPECSPCYQGNDFEFLLDSDATVSMTEHSRLHSCWWMGIIFSKS